MPIIPKETEPQRHSERVYTIADSDKKRPYKMWRYDYNKPSVKALRPDLFEAIELSGYEHPNTHTTSPMSQDEIRESKPKFRKRIAEQTIIFTGRQVDEFKRHRFTAIATPLDCRHLQFIDLKSLTTKLKRGKKPTFPLNVWVLKHTPEGIVVAISSQR